MSKTTDSTAKGQKEMHLPLEPLFMMLHNKGFQVRPDDYIEMLKAVERFGSADIDETAKYICPIVATDEAEQAAFYNVIEEYKKLNSGKKQVVVPPPVFPLWLKICLLVIGLILVPFLIYYFTIPVSKIFVPLTSHSTVVTEKGDTLQLDATELFNRNIQDTSAININWELEKGVSANGLHASHVFNTPGLHYVKRKFTSKTFTIPKNSDSLKIYVCEDLPDINIQLPEGPVFPKKKIILKATTDAAKGIVSSFKWRINNVTATGTTDSIEHIFDSAGNYEIQCMAVVGSIASPCTQTGITILHVEEPGLHYDAKVSGKGNVYKVKTTLKTWVTMLLLIPAFAGFVYYFIKKRNKPSKEPEPEQKANTSKKPPYQVPFERNDIKLIKRERELRSIFLQMRLKAKEETLVLSVYKTIGATIRSGGM
ncbi:MAG: hypothetical protein ABI921_14225, partial [Panacibacter sp.]